MKSMLRTKLYISCLFMTIFGCNTKETQIFKVNSFSTAKEVSDKSFITEVFIISNPPTDGEQLFKLIRNFNESTITNDLAAQRPLHRTRTFYRETRELNKNFKEKDPNKEGYFAKVDLSGYQEDQIMISTWEISNAGIAGFYTRYQDGKEVQTTSFSSPSHASEF